MVSVVIPCHNCAPFIHRAVKSVLAQPNNNMEIILVENNSTDDTLAVILEQQSFYPHKIIVLQEQKAGAPAARNCGLSHARGQWIQFLDADDELLTDKISGQVHLAEHFNVDIVAGASLLRYQTKRKEFEIVRKVDDDAWRGLLVSKLGITSSNLWRRQALVDVGGWDETVTSSQEYDLMFRMLKNGASLKADHRCRTIVHFSQNSVSKSSNKEKLEKIIRNRISLRLNIKEELQAKGLLNSNLNAALEDYINAELIANAEKLPEFCSSYLQQNEGNVKFKIIVKIKTRQYLAKIRNVLNI